MKATTILPVCALAAALVLSGCGAEKSPYPAEVEAALTAVAETPTEEGCRALIQVLTDRSGESSTGYTEELLLAYDALTGLGIFEAEDFSAQAELYLASDRPEEAVIALERAYRLAPDARLLEQVEAIGIPAESREELSALCLPAAEAFAAGETALPDAAEGWYETLGPATRQGLRSYLAGETGVVLQVGYDPQGREMTALWKQDGDRIRLLLSREGKISLLESALADGAFDGSYHLEQAVLRDGSVLLSDGTFREGIITGDWSARARFGAAGDLASLWNDREALASETYTGSFSGEGRALAQQRPNVTGPLGVVYAYNSSGKKFLYAAAPKGSDPAAFVFTAETLGLPAVPGLMQ